MDVSAIGQPQAITQPGRAQPTGEGFNTLLNGNAPSAPQPQQNQAAQVRQAADKLVSSALLKPLFDQMRSSPFKVARFHGGQGEKAFMQQLHAILGDRISQSANFGVGDAVYDKMTRYLNPAGEATPSREVNTYG
jgi:hypothetical protein